MPIIADPRARSRCGGSTVGVVPRSIGPYIAILEDFVAGRIGIAEFRTRIIQQYTYADSGVYWAQEWDQDVSDALDQMDGDAEVVYPEAPEESYVSDEELLRSCRENLAKLREALRRRGLDVGI